MEKLLEVREFDKISCNPDFKTEYAYLPEKVFRDFEEFIHAFAGDEEHADALEFLKIGYGNGAEWKNFLDCLSGNRVYSVDEKLHSNWFIGDNMRRRVC